ncbi:MAG: DUF2974 domain-containing protein [Eggerthellaceae bacterium]|nr:DUF2974 domain-containing protein [Eggerthellaceae bacterium]
MANIIDYVSQTTASFSEEPLNRVDSLVFSWLAYTRIPEEIPAAEGTEGETLATICRQDNLLGLVAPVYDPRSSEALLRAVAASPRFGDVRACRSVDTWSREGEVQFSATTFVLPAEAGVYVAFRGTDDSLVGWKENFNMAFTVVPAQKAATDYVEEVAAAYPEAPLWIGGHSKGGNLAAYAMHTVKASTRDKILKCFDHDAPGFLEHASAAEGWVDDLDAGRIDKTVPEESIIGLLFDNNTRDITVVKSTHPGILQHAPFTWVVDGKDFATASAVTYDAYRTNKRVNAWLKTLNTDEREKFIEVLYKLANATGEITLSGITSTLKDGSLDLALRRLDGLPDEDRLFFMETIDDLVATLLLGPAPTKPETPEEKTEAAKDKMDDITAHFEDRLSKLDKYGF